MANLSFHLALQHTHEAPDASSNEEHTQSSPITPPSSTGWTLTRIGSGNDTTPYWGRSITSSNGSRSGRLRNKTGDPSQYPLGSAAWRRALQEQQKRQLSLSSARPLSTAASKTAVAKAATSGPAVRARAAARESRRRQVAYMHSHGQLLHHR